MSSTATMNCLAYVKTVTTLEKRRAQNFLGENRFTDMNPNKGRVNYIWKLMFKKGDKNMKRNVIALSESPVQQDFPFPAGNKGWEG